VSRTIVSPLAAALAVACASSGTEPWFERAALNVPIERVEISHLGGVGLSGSALDGEGRLWAVAERQRMMVAIRRRQRGDVELWPVALRRVPDGLEAESLAWLGQNRFAIGTEQRGPARSEDLVLLLELHGAEAWVTGWLPLDYRALWGILAPDNQGIEGLCAAGGHLVAAGEAVIRERGRRFAPVARRKLDQDQWVPHLVELTSRRGKLAALDCRMAPDRKTLEVHAVERHYGITRVIRFSLPTEGGSKRLSAHVLHDLSARFARMPNVEGIVVDGNEIVLVTDHDALSEPGTTESIRLGPFDTGVQEAEIDD
jgi:hypothetical protein